MKNREDILTGLGMSEEIVEKNKTDFAKAEEIAKREEQPKSEKRGRKKKEPKMTQEEEQLVAFSKDLFSLMWSTVYSTLAKKYGSHWELQEKEAIILGQASEKVLNKYLPAFLHEHQEITLLAIALLNVSLPRVLQTKFFREGSPGKEKIETDDDEYTE